MNGPVTAAATVLLTLLLHAVVVATAALIGGIFLRDPARRDVLWKTALVLPFLTTGATVALGSRPDDRARVIALPALVRSAWTTAPMLTATSEVSGAGAERVVTTRVRDPLTQPLALATLIVALVPAAVALMRVAARRHRLRHALRGRKPLDAAALGNVVSPGSRVTVAHALTGAVALPGGEICLSPLVARLAPDLRAGILAHEAAHLARRDPLWFLVADVVAAALALVPPARWVAARLRRDAEFLCDDQAVRRVGSTAAYVEALARVAAAHDPFAAGTAPAAADSPLLRRVQRQLVADTRPGRTHGIAIALALAGLAAVVLALPQPRFTPGIAEVRSDVASDTGRDAVVLHVRTR